MPIWIDSLVPKMRIIGLSQIIIAMKISRTGEDPSIMVNSTLRPSRRREIQRRHAPSMQSLTSLMVFLEK